VIAAALGLGLGLAGGGCSFGTPPAQPPGEDSGLPGTDRLAIGLAEAKLAQLQRMRVHVVMVLADGTMQDVTASASLESDNAAVAIAPAPGQIDGGAQAGAATITARLGAARPATIKVTVTAKQCRPVINELQTGGLTAGDEWVEILNPCTTPITVDGWTLAYRGPATTTGPDSTPLVTLSGSLAPGAIRLYAGMDYTGANDGQWTGTSILGQTSGAVALRMGPVSTGAIGDSIAYGAVSPGHPFVETVPAPAMANNRPAQRLPFDGRDDDDNSVDFMQVTAGTPRAPNAP